MRIAMLATDSRENFRRYHEATPSFGAAPEALLQGFAGLSDVEIHVLSCTQQETAAPAKLAPNIYYHNLLVPKWGWLRTGYQGCIRAVRSKLSEICPDIVHGQGTERDCGIAAVMSGFPNVVTIHGNMAELARLYKARPVSYHWCAARLEDFTLRRTHGVFCNSKYTEGLVKPRTRRTWKVANAIRMEFFDAPQTTGSARRGAINVGVISPRKQQLELLDVARNVHRRHPGFRLNFIGSANPHDAYARMFLDRIQDRAQYSFAEYVGTMNTGQLIRAFDEAAVLLHFPFEEAFGLVVVEALSRGLKVFASREGGIIDIASSLTAITLVPSGDWQALTRAIDEWITAGCPGSDNTALLVRELYHPRTIAQRHLEIYHELISLGRPAA